MDYKEFCEHIKDEIKGFLPEQYASYDTQLHTVSKPNVGRSSMLHMAHSCTRYQNRMSGSRSDLPSYRR